MANPRSDGKRLSVLLVDDSDINHMVVASLVEGQDIELDFAIHGAEALQKLRDASQPYHLILMDLQMPVMDGYAATHAIRHALKLATPVIALSASHQASEVQHCIQVGMNGFLSKPIDGEKLLAVFDSIRGRAAAPAPAATAAPLSASLLRLDNLNALHDIAPTKLTNALRDAMANSRVDFEQAHRLWQNGELEAAARLVHKYRGSLGTFVHAAFVERTLALENAILGAEPDLEERFAEFRASLAELFNQLQQWLDKHSG
ncbi:hybrid sensor histidine kinase/response regulator [Chromobacterium sp. IIBBL 290-4]|uniref:response regulator n=1 Tax=Chromobacterium sp. IIBBL 290-4 TaxID=2953890 RepID=UPI0020B8350D|nr:hybrid sensor histidine kinase/response regulator [Chromobacterium sp. IIBBL 290-4]UTH73272.1 response regulator [Chromobacterium sp. IIBBL 290-4]